MINENSVPVSRVQQHFLDYGLVSKDPVRLRDGARVLGFQFWEKDGTLRWKRGSQIPEIPNRLNRRRIFSLCGKLVAVAFLKRLATAVTKGWDDRIKNTSLSQILAETLTRVRETDPIVGNWCTDGKEITVWVDASSVATGVVLETKGTVIEDACWLRPINDAQHINRAELDVALKGINLALQSEATVLHLVTNSVCVYMWISDTLTGRARVNMRTAGEMLVRRRLGTLRSLVKEYGQTIDVKLVKSCQNHADSLTRVPHRWMDLLKEGKEPVLESCAIVKRRLDKYQVADIHHQSGHPGAKWTFYFARLVETQVSKETANSVVKACETCRSIDPAPVRWKKGELGVTDNWKRLAMDITSHNGENFLTIIEICNMATTVRTRHAHCYPTVGEGFPSARPTDGNTDRQRHRIH